ncbi:MAG: iron ABC transporter permease [Cyclobacteriaceae bacterium]|nr:iron ABC transporter permease [Cyclobacteriaceae bacterium]MCB0499938.1 iron ABC transporter permease [Cyclobacteriaceae bacterium]MCB9237244.1 iron ABC transporter permease [Flammeovirgaceae bacterium]MCO5270954.1 iron ABC transporter permease [Cyclobacteriaceae bacterium]MCW5901760.1 iron ABC transporter permease [Cyclobacteriaceae bacterium]
MNLGFKPLPALALTGALLLLFLANISLGSIQIPFPKVVSILFSGGQAHDTYASIMWQLRVPKAVTCVVAGSALSIAGLLMQTLFRNPLAGPDVLGLSSGASLMVALVLLVGTSAAAYLPVVSPWSLALAASLGSGTIFLLVIAVAHRVKDNTSLLIIGLMIAAASGSFVSVLQYLSKAQDLQAFVIWTLGSVGGTNWSEIAILALLLIVGGTLAITSTKSLNAWLLGDHYAQSLGIDIKKSRQKAVLATSLLAGGVTAFCGPIAFVGLAVPHLVRLLVPTTNHRVLVPMVMMGGAALLLLCDLLAQVPGGSNILPLNAITSMIGAPVVIWVVMRSKGVKM